jgi:hypothetical protein
MVKPVVIFAQPDISFTRPYRRYRTRPSCSGKSTADVSGASNGCGISRAKKNLSMEGILIGYMLKLLAQERTIA